MVLDSNFGKFDFSRPKVRLDGEVLDKYSLVTCLRNLNFKRFYWMLYIVDSYSYVELRETLFEYLSEVNYGSKSL